MEEYSDGAISPIITRLVSVDTASRSRGCSPLEEEVTRLFEQFRGPLLRYLLSLGLTTPDGEEVIQEVFLALFRHLQTGKPRDNLRGWIFRVGHNQALKLRNRDIARPVCADDEAVERHTCPEPNPEQQASSNQTQRRVSAVIRALPELDRACLTLRAEGLGYREISSILGISVGGVSLALTRSLSKISRVHEPGREGR